VPKAVNCSGCAINTTARSSTTVSGSSTGSGGSTRNGGSTVSSSNVSVCDVWLFSVVHVNEDTTLQDVVRGTDDDYDFCMCNPPFYGSNLEAWGWLTTRNDADRPRAEPTSVSTASPIEGIAPGGEVQFVRERIIDSSVELQTRVRYVGSIHYKVKQSGHKHVDNAG